MKVADAEIDWQQKATRIQRGEEKSMLTILEERGLIQTVTGSVLIYWMVVWHSLILIQTAR